MTHRLTGKPVTAHEPDVGVPAVEAVLVVCCCKNAAFRYSAERTLGQRVTALRQRLGNRDALPVDEHVASFACHDIAGKTVGDLGKRLRPGPEVFFGDRIVAGVENDVIAALGEAAGLHEERPVR